MKIAIVIPLLHKIAGNRLALDIAEAFERLGNTVYLFSEIASKEAIDYVSQTNLRDRFFYIRRKEANFSPLKYALRRFSRKKDRRLLKLLDTIHHKERFDVVLVISNEGHYLGQLLKKRYGAKAPLTALSIMELIEYPFILNNQQKRYLLRLFTLPFLPFLHLIELNNIKKFDLIVSNSQWTSIMTQAFYGQMPEMSIASVNTSKFNFTPQPGGERYIAFPTLGLNKNDIQVAINLKREGINLLSFGPIHINGIEYIGYLSELQLRQVYAKANATLYLFDYEALGLPVLESLASGTPVITTPKQGPYVVHANNPNVHFMLSYETLLNTCRLFLSQDKTKAEIISCKDSVAGFSSDIVAENLVKILSNKKYLLNLTE